MFNFSIISLISFVLIYQNIILLNEETLILICFITFCWITFIQFNEFIYTNLKQQSFKITNSLENSLIQLEKLLNYNIKFQKKFLILPINFTNLANHFLKLNFVISNKLFIYSIYKSEKIYPKKILFVQHFEQQTSKLLALILIQKLNKIVKLNQFFSNNFKNNIFLCKQNTILREYIKNI